MTTPILAITGNIGSGKSTATRMLQSLGAICIDADQLARDVVQPGSAALQKIQDTFGNDILTADGHLDRKALGTVVFENTDARKKLEAITHPQILLAMMQALADAQQQEPPLIVLEIPLLFEGKMHHQFPRTLLVTAQDSIRLTRVTQRDGITEAEAQARLNAQMPQDEKIPLATWVVPNNGDAQTLETRLRNLWPALTDTGDAADN